MYTDHNEAEKNLIQQDCGKSVSDVDLTYHPHFLDAELGKVEELSSNFTLHVSILDVVLREMRSAPITLNLPENVEADFVGSQ